MAQGELGYTIDQYIRLPQFLHLARRTKEAWTEFNKLLFKGYPKQFASPEIAPMERSKLLDKMRLFLEREGQDVLASIFGHFAAVSWCVGLFRQGRREELECSFDGASAKSLVDDLRSYQGGGCIKELCEVIATEFAGSPDVDYERLGRKIEVTLRKQSGGSGWSFVMHGDMMAFWSEHPPLEAFAAVDAVLGKVVKCRLTGQFKEHHILHIGYPADYDLSAVEPRLRRELDALGWQFVTTGTRLDLRDTGEILSFGVAPILLRAVPVAYHATRACIIPLILKDGLLPSNAERRATTFPDTEGVIHACAKLTHAEGENDSAEWWRQELSKKNRFNDPQWGIMRIDLAGLAGARVHQDMHSQSGLIIDKTDRVPPDLVSPVM